MAAIALYFAGAYPVVLLAIKRYGAPHWPSVLITAGIMIWYDVAKAIGGSL